jgi:hypothetical protein
MQTCTVQGHFDIAAGSVTGRDHVLVGRNNQDAYHWACLPQAVMAIVCDGYGSGKHSEVGAQIGARLMIEAMSRAMQGPAHAFWYRVRQDVLTQLRCLAEQLGGNFPSTVQDYLLFTVVGALVTPQRTFCFSPGDGVMVVNGDQILLGPFPDNAPPSLAYELFDVHNGRPLALSQKFRMQRVLPTTAVQSIVLGTDSWLFAPTDEGIIRVEPQHGQLVQTRLFPDTEPFVDSSCHLFAGQQGMYVVDRQHIYLLSIA